MTSARPLRVEIGFCEGAEAHFSIGALARFGLISTSALLALEKVGPSTLDPGPESHAAPNNDAFLR